jgi:hypothetical protein
VCLAGGHQELKRNEVLELLDYYHLPNKALVHISADSILLEVGFCFVFLFYDVMGFLFLSHQEYKGHVNQFILMFFKSKSLAFKGIYLVDQNSS